MSKTLEKFKTNKLNEGESIIVSSEGYIGEMMGKGDKEQHNGVLVLTNERLVFYSKTWLKEVHRSMPIRQISSINFTAGWLKKTLALVSNNDTIEFKFLGTKEEIESFQKEVENIRDKINSASNSASNSVQESIPDQIKKLAELKELGILSDEEFQSKKQSLLDKM